MPAKIINAQPEIIVPKIRGRHTGAAKAIRKLKLKHPDLSENEIARTVKCDKANVHRVLARFHADAISQDDHEIFNRNQADIISRTKQRMLMSLTDDHIAKASVRDRMVSFGILHDKEQVLLGKATSISVVQLLDAVEMIREMRRSES